MVIDTSAMIAVLFHEAESGALREAIRSDAIRLMSVVPALETSCVVESRRGERAGAKFELLLHKIGIRMEAFDGNQLEIARTAWRRFGKGRHPAGLNFGDCVSYALAKAAGEPLLYKGEDFARTDIERVVWGGPRVR